MIRSTWTSVDQPEWYLRWAASVAASTRVENDVSLITWNLDKRHLLELEAAGLPTAPTTWIRPGDDFRPPDGSFVVKPAVSGGGRNTALYTAPSATAVEHVGRLQADGQTVMVQQYLDTIADGGETKMVYIDGEFSHAVNVGPLLEPDGGLLDRPWEKPVSVRVDTPTEAEMETANQVMSFVRARFGRPLYRRVDTCLVGGTPVILEVEFVDPSLSLWAAPHAAHLLATAIARSVA